MVDLRPDATVQSGFALVAGNGVLALADALASDPSDTVGPTVRTLLGNKLGLSLSGSTIQEVLAELLFVKTGKWNPAAASLSRKIKEIYIGGELWASKAFDPGPAGDTDPTDNFIGADANPIGGNWTTSSGLAALRRISNQLANAGARRRLSGLVERSNFFKRPLQRDYFCQWRYRLRTCGPHATVSSNFLLG
jgi:hypothetical protein